MKKLNLKLGSIKEMLTKEQMKSITGGYGTCYVECDEDYYACCNDGDLLNSVKCKCIVDGGTAVCGSGGPGTHECGVG